MFPYEAENYLFDFCEAACWNFDGVALNLELVSGKATIFTILILLSYKHRGSSHLLISLISFFSVLMLLLYKWNLPWLELFKLFLRALWKVVSLIFQCVCYFFKEGHWEPFMYSHVVCTERNFDFFPHSLPLLSLLQLPYCSDALRHSTVLNKYGGDLLVFVSDFSGHVLNFSPFRLMLALGFL